MDNSSRKNRKYCFAVDLKNDPELIAQYRHYHQQDNIWPEVVEHIKETGIVEMNIYCIGDRLTMFMEVDERFSLDSSEDSTVPAKIKDWDSLMSNFQLPLKWAPEGQTWVLMDEIFSLHQ